MDEPDDIQLLRRFVADNSETAFAELVRRQIDLVFSAALRQTGNASAAEEATQAVFVVLARKAGGLLRLRSLSGWLYQAARLTAANYLRTERRRARREEEACMQWFTSESAHTPDEAWRQSAPLLEKAMGKLRARDREAVLLRYFQNKSLREVGLALGVGEDAARMRVNRALERLRRFFNKRSVALSAAALATVLSTRSAHAAPPGLAASVAVGAAKGYTLGGSVAALANGTLRLLAWARFKLYLGVCASTIVAAGALLMAWNSGSNARPQQAAILPPGPGPITGIGPFNGSGSEGFDTLGIAGAQHQVRILRGAATVSNLTRGGTLKIERYSSLDGVVVTPRSPPSMLGQLGISQWVFDPPVAKFGAYFQNNSRFDNARVDFFDGNDTLLASMTATVPKTLRAWTWNGWQSDVPIRRVVVTGNDAAFLHGFIWFDDVQVISSTPP